ncbi:MAG: hypothetical protein KAH77_04530, partial [Thiomargarita sp.]|nr:hypothetical protein [Thiomargarita sp.]
MPEFMSKESRDLILATEISGLLHDLGKLHPGFLREKTKNGKLTKIKSHLQTTAHGKILETDKRDYPKQDSDAWLQELKKHEQWAKILKIPEKWINPHTVQAFGLGDALRQHHANSNFLNEDFTLLGDMCTFAADGRDSALDKTVINTKSGEQRLETAYISDCFGNETTPYQTEELRKTWRKAQEIIQEGVLKKTENLVEIRNAFINSIKPEFSKALGATQRPTNDVTLWHHSFATASLFKAAVAECVLRKDFTHLQKDNSGLFDNKKLGRLRFRLLGIRWNWTQLTQGALQPIVFFSLTQQREKAIKKIRELLETTYPIGNILYEDDDGVVLVVPGFYEQEDDKSERLFNEKIVIPLKDQILNALVDLGAGTPIRLAWTLPRLYLTDYPEVMSVTRQGKRELLLQIGQEELKRNWAKQVTSTDGQVQICTQCGLRPSNTKVKELTISQSTLKGDLGDDKKDLSIYGLCKYCANLAHPDQKQSRWKDVFKNNPFGFEPKTFELQEISQQNKSPDNARVVLISVRIDTQEIANGLALLTQVANPSFDFDFEDKDKKLSEDKKLSDSLKKELQNQKKAHEYEYTNFIGKFLEEEILSPMRSQDSIKKISKEIAKFYVKDNYWFGKDGRVDGNSKDEKARKLLEEFLLREEVPDTLSRHDGDKLAIFGMRKHASPGRLFRVWDDLRQLWKNILKEIGGLTDNYTVPLSLDAQGFRVIVAAEDAQDVLICIHNKIQKRLNKVRASFNPHVSALVFKDKFPLYIAFDAMRRMEKRITELPTQEWILIKKVIVDKEKEVCLTWKKSDWELKWAVNIGTGDPEQEDLWYPHVICTSR